VTVYLHSVGHFHPENEISNQFLEDLDIGTNDQWILERVGIRSRRTVLPLEYISETRNAEPREAMEAALHSNADLGQRAAELAIARAGIEKSDVGMLIGGSSVMDTATPAEACNIARGLELEVPTFDVNSACTSFYVQLYLLSMMQPDLLPDYVVVVATDCLTKSVDYTDRSAAVLWGDGAAAAVISTRHPARARIEGNTMESSPAGNDKIVVPRMGFFRQEGRTVQTFGIKRMVRMLNDLRDRFEDPERRFNFVGHQANARMLESVCKHCDIPDERHFSNVEWFGNTASASSATVISMEWEKWRDGDDVGVVGVGAGLTWSGYLIRFGEIL
jgi:3-oxoacyl-[acyl-carrier-protein] synthase-3